MKRLRRMKVAGAESAYHCMTRVVNGERLFGDREKEMLRRMLWQNADFCGVEILTYCVMSNHFHVLVLVPEERVVDDRELMRRYRVLYPKPTDYQAASAKVLERQLAEDGPEAAQIREQLLARMGDVSEFMKSVKQRFSVWYNRNHGRYGTLWAERFKSVLVEGQGNALQTVAAYIDLNPVRAGLVEDPKDYRFCGYAEAVACSEGLGFGQAARRGLERVWADFGGSSARDGSSEADIGALRDGGSLQNGGTAQDGDTAQDGGTAMNGGSVLGSGSAPGSSTALQCHRELIFGKWASEPGLSDLSREKALKVLEEENAILPKAEVLRCRVRYFTDGAILGSQEFVRSYVEAWQRGKGRKHPPKPKLLRGADWQGLAIIHGLRRQVFG
jgi:REP element-mobilizing transposase RayT